jgi:hypothetical protein
MKSGHLPVNGRTRLLIPHPEEQRVRRVSKDEGPFWGLMVLPAMRSIVRGRRFFELHRSRDGLAPLGLLGCCASSP